MTPLYRIPLLYEAMMLSLYGRQYGERYRAIADIIPVGASVLDLCSGPGTLFTHFLRPRGHQYTGLDLSEPFVRHLRSKGAAAEVWDVSEARPLPSADVVVMQGSLCHFLPEVGPILRRMLVAARHMVIVSEPVQGVIHSGNAALAALAGYLTDPGNGQSRLRFTEAKLRESMAAHFAHMETNFMIPGGRDHIYVLKATASHVEPPSYGPPPRSLKTRGVD